MSCFFTHPTDRALAFIWSRVFVHTANVSQCNIHCPFSSICLNKLLRKISGYLAAKCSTMFNSQSLTLCDSRLALARKHTLRYKSGLIPISLSLRDWLIILCGCTFILKDDLSAQHTVWRTGKRRMKGFKHFVLALTAYCIITWLLKALLFKPATC